MTNTHRYNPVTPAILDELTQICGEANVIFGNEKTLQKYSRDQIPERFSQCKPHKLDQEHP
jgi:hypothetical protein